MTGASLDTRIRSLHHRARPAMKLHLEINMENAYFGDTEADRTDVVSQIMRSLIRAERPLGQENLRITLRDGNGNRVGSIWTKGRP